MTRRIPIAALAEISPNPDPSDFTDGSRVVDFVPMADLSEKGFVAPKQTRQLSEVRNGFTYFANTDVIIAKITPCMENGKAAYVAQLPHGVAFGSTEFHVLRPGPRLYGRYLFYMVWNDAFRREAAGKMQGGAGQKRVPTAFLKQFAIPIPFPDDPVRSLAEQKRIAAILDKADAIRRNTERAVALPSQAVCSEFRSRFVSRRAYALRPLSCLVAEDDSINYGIVQPGDDVRDGLPIVRVGDFRTDMTIDRTFLKRVSPTIESQYLRSRLKGDEVLIACVGSIGMVALADETLRDHNIVRAVARVRCGSELDRVYLAWCLMTPDVQHYFQAETRTVAQPTLNIRHIEQTPIPLPPMHEQQAFVRVAEQARTATNHLNGAARDGEALFAALVQRAFRGEL